MNDDLRDFVGCLGLFAILFLISVVLVSPLYIGNLLNYVTTDRAIERIQEQNPEIVNIKEVRNSGNRWYQDFTDVVFELAVTYKNGTTLYIQYECVDNWFAPMICIRYGVDK
jgi:hypothetical protein